MAFRFSLETLLRVRLSLERQHELLLQEANLRVALLQRQIAGVDSGRETNLERQRPHLESGLSAAELQFDMLCDSVLLKRRGDLERQLVAAEVLRHSRNEEFQQARRQRETMDTVRRRQLEIYRQQEARQDQRRIDDLFLLRRAYLRRG
jgi:flagellar export protein FliJ